MPVQRNRQIILRLTEDEAAELRRRAKAADETVAAYMRHRLLGEGDFETMRARFEAQGEQLLAALERFQNG